MSKGLKFLKTVVVYFSGNILTKIISFLLIPLYTSRIEPSEYGHYDLIVSIITMIVPIAFFQIWDGMFRFIYDYKEKKDKYAIISNGFVVAFIGLIFYTIIFIILTMNYEIQYPVLAFLYGVSIALQYIYGTITRTFERNVLYMASGIANSLFNIISNIILIAIFNMGINALYISAVLGTLIQFILIEIRLNPIKNFKIENISKKLIVRMLKFSMPIAITTVSYWLLSGFTKVVVTNILGSDENGRLAIVNKFSNTLNIVVTVFQMAWHELSFSLANDRNKKIYYENGINLFSIFLFLGLGILIPVTKVIFPYMVDEKYASAIIIIPITYIYTSFNALSSFMSTQLLAEKNSKDTFYSTLAAAILNVILSISLTKRYGIVGANIALLISFIVNFIIIKILLKNKYNINISKNNNFLIIFITFVTTLIFYKGNNVIKILYAIIVLVISLILFYKLMGQNIIIKYKEFKKVKGLKTK